MGIPVLILGNSGTGKTTSLRNLDPKTTLLIQSVKKSLPFKSNNWKPLTKDNRDGSILVTRDYPVIHKSIHKAVNELGKKIIIIDDSNYLMSLEEMSRVNETGYKKFTDMAINFSGLIFMSQDLPDDVRVYFMAHTQTADDGR